MKKAFTVILALVYLVTSTGAVVNIHYCMGKVASVGLSVEKDEKCSSCGMKSGGKCCKDELKKLQIDKDQKLTTTDFQVPHFFGVLPVYAYGFINKPGFSLADYPVAQPPPAQRIVPLFLRNCNFRI